MTWRRLNAAGIAFALTMTLSLGACNAPFTSKPSPFWGGKPPNRDVVLPALPQPVTIAADSPDRSAAALASQATTGGDRSFPAVLAAVQASGFSIRNSNGDLLVQPALPSQGFAIDQAHAIGLGMAAANPSFMTLTDLVSALGAGIPDLKSSHASDMVLDGIRADSASTVPTARFWARFIIEIGKLSAVGRPPYDLSGSVDPSIVYLDLIQVEFILIRLTADLTGLQKQLKTGAQASAPAAAIVWPALITDARAAGGSGPCNMTESVSQIMDVNAIGFTKGFEKLMDYLEKAHVPGAGAWLVVAGWANAIFSWAKVVLYFSALHVEIKMNGAGPPLIRTKTTQMGEQRQLIGHARMEFKNGQMVNCFRIMLNSLGMDLSGPSDGYVTGAPANWILVRGGVSGLSTANRIVEFYGGDAANSRTDESGETRIGIEGYKQTKPIPDSAVQVVKQAEVWLLVTPKPPSFSQDIIDAVGGAAAGLAGMLITAPAEMLLRSRLLKPAEYPFDVIDWGNDFKVDVTGPAGSLKMTGIKCDGPQGEWDLDITGTVGLATYSGKLVAQLDPSLKGPIHETLNVAVQGLPGSAVASGDGTAQFKPGDKPGDKPTLDLSLPDLTAVITVEGHSFPARVKGMSGSHPVEAGTFCTTP